MSNIAKYNLSNQFPSNTYQYIVLYAAESSSFTDGNGNVVSSSINITSSNTVSASVSSTSSCVLGATCRIYSGSLQLFNPTDSFWYRIYIDGSGGIPQLSLTQSL